MMTHPQNSLCQFTSTRKFIHIIIVAVTSTATVIVTVIVIFIVSVSVMDWLLMFLASMKTKSRQCWYGQVQVVLDLTIRMLAEM